MRSCEQQMHQWTGSSLVQVMACPLFSTRPLPESKGSYCQFHGLVQERSNYSALALELLLSCNNPSSWAHMNKLYWNVIKMHFSYKTINLNMSAKSPQFCRCLSVWILWKISVCRSLGIHDITAKVTAACIGEHRLSQCCPAVMYCSQGYALVQEPMHLWFIACSSTQMDAMFCNGSVYDHSIAAHFCTCISNMTIMTWAVL